MKMNRLILLCLLVFSSQIVWSQSAQTYPVVERSTDWILYQEADGIQQYYKFEECINEAEGYFREYVLIKLVNTTPVAKQVDWDIVLFYGKNTVNFNTDNPELHRSVLVPAASTVEGNCKFGTDKTLKMFSKFLNYDMDDWVLSHFELRNFSVK